MSALRRTLQGIGVAALVPAAAVAVGVVRLDGLLRWPDIVALAGCFWLLFAVIFTVPFIGLAVVAASRRRQTTTAGAWALASATLFALFWYERLKPIELWTVRYRPGAYDATGLAAIALLTTLIAMCVAAGRPSIRASALRSVGATLVGSAILAAYIHLFEPSPDRTPSAQRLAQSSHASVNIGSPLSRRVLFIGVDGLDWAAVERLIAQRRLPQIEQLLAHGRSYELDAGRLSLSPEIWTAMYTGRDPRFSGYETWDFRGVSHSIEALPAVGHRPVWGIHKWLWRTTALGLWMPVSVTTARLTEPTFWRIASAAGLAVGVFEPVPYTVLGEEVDGVFAWEDDDDYDAHWNVAPRAPWDEQIPFPGRYRESAPESIEVERRRRTIVGDLLARARLALGVYYTPVVDEAGHWAWPSARPLGRAASPGEHFDHSIIASAYEEVDRSIGLLRERFGTPQIVVLASDHGWEFNAYQHSRVPHGMLIVSHAGLSGFGGTVPASAVASTVLSLLGLPRGAAWLQPVDGVPVVGSVDYSGIGPAFITPTAPRSDAGARERLKSLGYIGR